MTVLNTGRHTRLSPTGIQSAPDVTIGGSQVALRAEWSILEDIGSDHLPILLQMEVAGGQRPRPPGRHSVGKCDWGQYAEEVARRLPLADLDGVSVDAAAANFTDAVVSAFKCSAPFGARRDPKCWWTPACDDALRELRRAKARLKREKSEEAASAYTAAREKVSAT